MRALAGGAVSAAVHRGDGRQECLHRHRARRTSSARPSASCARAFGMGGQKCSALSRLYVHAAVADAADRDAVSTDRRDPHRRSDAARELAGPGHHRSGATQLRALHATQLRSAVARASSAAASSCSEGALAQRLLRARRRSPKRRSTHPLWQRGDVPADPHAAPRSDLERGAMALANDSPLGPHRRLLRQRRRGRAGSTTTSRPA